MSGPMAIRDAYGFALEKLGGINPQAVVLEADVGASSKSAAFGKAYPERYFNVGIAELNMTAMAAGFASCGLIPFVNTFAVFLTTRASDPIHSLVAYDNLNVKLCGAYSGLSDSFDGASHHAICDLALMLSLPNMTVLSPCDPVEAEKAVFAAAEHPGPVYLRLSRAPAPVLFGENYDFAVGRGVVLRNGKDVTLAATGYMVHKALEAASLLEKEGVSARVVDFHTIKPLDISLLLRCANETGAVVTAEEHSLFGGLGTAVSQALATGNARVPVEMAGLAGYAESGPYEALLSKYGLDARAIAAKARAAISRKLR